MPRRYSYRRTARQKWLHVTTRNWFNFFAPAANSYLAQTKVICANGVRIQDSAIANGGAIAMLTVKHIKAHINFMNSAEEGNHFIVAIMYMPEHLKGDFTTSTATDNIRLHPFFANPEYVMAWKDVYPTGDPNTNHIVLSTGKLSRKLSQYDAIELIVLNVNDKTGAVQPMSVLYTAEYFVKNG